MILMDNHREKIAEAALHNMFEIPLGDAGPVFLDYMLEAFIHYSVYLLYLQ